MSRSTRPAPSTTEARGVLRGEDRQSGLLAQPLVQRVKQRAAARQHDALVHHVGREFRRHPFKGLQDGLDDLRNRFIQRFPDLAVGNPEASGHAAHEITPLDVHVQRLLERKGGADLDLDPLGGPLADQHVVLALQMLGNRLVHRVARHAERAAVDRPGERNDGDVAGAAADVDDHVARRFRDRQAGADRRHHRLLDQKDLRSPGAHRRLPHRPFLHRRDLRRHADHDPRASQPAAVVGLADEVLEHVLGHLEVGDHAVLHRPYEEQDARRASEHLLGLGADRLDAVALAVDDDHRRLADDDAVRLGEDERVGRTQVDGQVAGEPLQKTHSG